MIFAGFAALIPAGLIAFLALSKKTSPTVKKAATIALIVITLTFVACTIILVLSGSPAWKRGGAIDLPTAPPAGKANNIMAVLIMAAVLFFVMIMVIVLAIRERKK